MDNNVSCSSEKRLIFEKLFELMVEFDRVCEENDLKYSLHAGSLLGAVRHNDFIPWDDDVDIIMYRDDYDKLINLSNKGCFRDPFFLQSPIEDKGSPRMFLRLRDSSTTSVSYGDALLKMNHGMFIDIFPADYIPNNKIKRTLMIKKLVILDKLLGAYSRYFAGVGTKGDGIAKKLMYLLLLPFFKFNIITSTKLFITYQKISAKYNRKSEQCDNIADTLWIIYDSNYYFPKACFENGLMEHEFHGRKFYIFKEYDDLLKRMYGDYMTPREEPTAHGNLIQRVDISYKEFIEKNFEEIKNNWKK